MQSLSHVFLVLTTLIGVRRGPGECTLIEAHTKICHLSLSEICL